MTPENAGNLIDGIDFYDKHQMWGEFPDRYDPYTVYELAEIVAGLKYEYAVEVQPVPGGAWHQVTQWTPDPSPVLPEGRALDPDERIVRRLAGEKEVVS